MATKQTRADKLQVGDVVIDEDKNSTERKVKSVKAYSRHGVVDVELSNGAEYTTNYSYKWTVVCAEVSRVDVINNAAFALESVAHMQGMETLLLPHARNLRKIADELEAEIEENKI